MALFGLQKKILQSKLALAKKLTARKQRILKKQAKQDKDLNKIKKDIQKASQVKLTKSEQKILSKRSDRAKSRKQKIKSGLKAFGDFAVKINKELQQELKKSKKPASSRKKTTKRRKRKSY